MSSFWNMMGPSDVGAHASIWKSLGRTCPSSSSACGCERGTVVVLTGSRPSLRSRSTKDKSRIARNYLVLWGMAAMGDTLRLGVFVLNVIPVDNPCVPLLDFLQGFILQGFGRDGGLCRWMCAKSMAAWIWLCVHCRPQSTGHPSFPIARRKSAAGWFVAGPVGKLSPRASMCLPCVLVRVSWLTAVV